MMKKKPLPKTPASLFDDIENSPSPIPLPKSQSGTPTPRPRPLSKNQSLPLLIRAIRVASFIIAILLFATITQKFIPINYCKNDEQSDICEPCPNNAICADGGMLCKEQAIYVKGDEHEYCIIEGSLEYDAKENVSFIEKLIQDHDIKTLDDPHLNKFTEECLRLAIDISDHYSYSDNGFLFKNRIMRKWPDNQKTMILCSLLVMAISIHIMTYYFHKI